MRKSRFEINKNYDGLADDDIRPRRPDFRPTPEVPESFSDKLYAWGMSHGTERLGLAWDPWRHYWTITSTEEYYDDGLDSMSYCTIQWFPCLTKEGEMMPLDRRIFEALDEKYIGETKVDHLDYYAQKAIREKKAKDDLVEKRNAARAESFSRDAYEVNCGRSAASVLKEGRPTFTVGADLQKV